MDQVYVLISNLLEILLKDIDYVFKKMLETQDTFEFVLVLEKQSSEKYLTKKNNIVKIVEDAFNIKESISAKKIKILVEVFDEFR